MERRKIRRRRGETERKKVTLRRGRANRRLGAREMTEWWEKGIKEGKRKKKKKKKANRGKTKRQRGKRSQEIRR